MPKEAFFATRNLVFHQQRDFSLRSKWQKTRLCNNRGLPRGDLDTEQAFVV